MKVSKKIIRNNEEIKLDISNIAYEDLQGIARLLGFGIIMESGSSEGWEFLKFGNGWMVQFIRNISVFGGNSHYTQRSVDFAEPFILVPIVVPVPTARRVNGAGTTTKYFNAIPSSIGTQGVSTLRYMYGDGSTITSDTELVVDLIVIGRWK